MYISLAFAYIVTYPAIEADSPSLVMIMSIAETEPKGLDKGLFEQKMNDEILVIPRIKDLINSGLAYKDKTRYRLTPKGILISKIFIKYRRLLRRDKKGG
ncbi:MAG: hypothetical protein AB1422_05950 [bacterium]